MFIKYIYIDLRPQQSYNGAYNIYSWVILL